MFYLMNVMRTNHIMCSRCLPCHYTFIIIFDEEPTLLEVTVVNASRRKLELLIILDTLKVSVYKTACEFIATFDAVAARLF